MPSGLCAAFVGLDCRLLQLQNRAPGMTGNMFEMDAIGATAGGGTALAGSRPGDPGRIIGSSASSLPADGMVMMMGPVISGRW